MQRWIEAKDRIDVFLEHEVTALSQDENGVALEHRSGGETLTLAVAYAVGCDHASSFLRRALGIEWQSLGYDQDRLVIDIVIGPDAELPLQTMQVCDPERLTTYVCVKDPNRRWEFQLRPGETWDEMQQPERIRELLDDWLPREHYTLRCAAVYQFHAATAARSCVPPPLARREGATAPPAPASRPCRWDSAEARPRRRSRAAPCSEPGVASRAP